VWRIHAKIGTPRALDEFEAGTEQAANNDPPVTKRQHKINVVLCGGDGSSKAYTFEVKAVVPSLEVLTHRS
jgi:hypothetical protein